MVSKLTVAVFCSIQRTPRVQQVEGLFDLAPSCQTELRWEVALPLEERPWHVGLIVGPSGCGKSTIARRLWPSQLAYEPAWSKDQAILDAFPETLSIKEIVALLSSVGFSSPPAWLRPFAVLSTGQQFRARLAVMLAACPALAVMDEFTSTVDRTVAQIGSHALAKTVRQRGQKFIAVTCHEDVESWLNPDWVYRPDANTFTWRCLQRRPAIELQISRAHRQTWHTFKHHHYLSTALAPAAVCFAAFWQDRIVAFSAWVPALTRRGGKREHRTVTLPDYQGVGIGHALSTHLAAMWKALGHRAVSTTTHPAFIAARQRSPHWRMVRAPSLARARGRFHHATTRLTAGFEYIGPPLDAPVATKLWAGSTVTR
ncbi:MAG TPA: GNAT family N-acetyltransferase [Gemmataceae bacterium]|nr:GNAT family N-acetyltransferase [Gemmataceae bacterium]